MNAPDALSEDPPVERLAAIIERTEKRRRALLRLLAKPTSARTDIELRNDLAELQALESSLEGLRRREAVLRSAWRRSATARRLAPYVRLAGLWLAYGGILAALLYVQLARVSETDVDVDVTTWSALFHTTEDTRLRLGGLDTKELATDCCSALEYSRADGNAPVFSPPNGRITIGGQGGLFRMRNLELPRGSRVRVDYRSRERSLRLVIEPAPPELRLYATTGIFFNPHDGPRGVAERDGKSASIRASLEGERMTLAARLVDGPPITDHFLLTGVSVDEIGFRPATDSSGQARMRHSDVLSGAITVRPRGHRSELLMFQDFSVDVESGVLEHLYLDPSGDLRVRWSGRARSVGVQDRDLMPTILQSVAHDQSLTLWLSLVLYVSIFFLSLIFRRRSSAEVLDDCLDLADRVPIPSGGDA